MARSHAEGPCALEPALPVRRLRPVAAVHTGEASLSQLSLFMSQSQLYTGKLITLPERQQEIKRAPWVEVGPCCMQKLSCRIAKSALQICAGWAFPIAG